MSNEADIRIERNIKEIKRTRDELREAIKGRNWDAVYAATFELSNWITNSDTWFNENHSDYRINKNNEPEIKKLILGIRQVYNSFKHNMRITSVEAKDYSKNLFGMTDFVLERVIWIKSTEIKQKKNNIQAYKAYQQCLEGKSVLETFDKVIPFLMEQARKHV